MGREMLSHDAEAAVLNSGVQALRTTRYKCSVLQSPEFDVRRLEQKSV